MTNYDIAYGKIVGALVMQLLMRLIMHRHIYREFMKLTRGIMIAKKRTKLDASFFFVCFF